MQGRTSKSAPSTQRRGRRAWRSLVALAVLFFAARSSAQDDAGSPDLAVEHRPLTEACGRVACPSYDQAVAAARAAADAPHCGQRRIGTCGAYRFVTHDGGLGGETRWFDASGQLVALSAYDDTLRFVDYGTVPVCERVVTEDVCHPGGTPAPTSPRATPSRMEISDAMSAIAPEVAGCLPDGLETVTVRVTLAPAGRLESAVPTSRLAGPVEACIRRALRQVRVPRFGPAPFTFLYPFRRGG